MLFRSATLREQRSGSSVDARSDQVAQPRVGVATGGAVGERCVWAQKLAPRALEVGCHPLVARHALGVAEQALALALVAYVEGAAGEEHGGGVPQVVAGVVGGCRLAEDAPHEAHQPRGRRRWCGDGFGDAHIRLPLPSTSFGDTNPGGATRVRLVTTFCTRKRIQCYCV